MTNVLPAWKTILKDRKWTITLMPLDVATRWNLTFDLLEYALSHKKELDTVTQQRDLGLRSFELRDHEWELIEQLHDVLKVRALMHHVDKTKWNQTLTTPHAFMLHNGRFSNTQHFSSLILHPILQQ